MADKIDQLKIGNKSYDIDLPPDATPSIASLTVGGSSVMTEGYLGFTTDGKNYPVQKSSGGKLYVNVPWSDTDTNTWRPIGTGATDAAAGNHTHTTIVGNYTSNGGQQGPTYFGTNRVGALMMNTTVNSNSQYKDWLFMDCYAGNDVGGGVAFGVNRQSLGAYIMRSDASSSGHAATWKESAELLGTHHLGGTASGKVYPVELSNGKLMVSVPWTDTDTNTWPTNYLVSASKSGSTLTVKDNAGNSYSLTDTNSDSWRPFFINGSDQGSAGLQFLNNADEDGTNGIIPVYWDTTSYASVGNGVIAAAQVTSKAVTDALGYTPGTSNLTLGTTSTTAAAGNHTHSQYSTTDTKNTTGTSDNTGSGIFHLVGAYTQSSYAYTYTKSSLYYYDSALYTPNLQVGNGWRFNAAGTIDSEFITATDDQGLILKGDVLITGKPGHGGDLSGSGAGTVNGRSVSDSTTAGTADLVVQGNIIGFSNSTWSDARLKHDIVDTEIDYNQILDNLHIADFKYKVDKDQNINVGLIAQELQEVLPDKYKDCFVQENKTTGYLSINENKLVYVALLALKEQKAQIKNLNDRLEALEKIIYEK